MRVTSVNQAVLIAIILSPALRTADSALTFSRTFGGATGTTVVNAIATDPSGNIIVSGTTTAAMHAELLHAPSKGRYFNQVIRGRFSYARAAGAQTGACCPALLSESSQ